MLTSKALLLASSLLIIYSKASFAASRTSSSGWQSISVGLMMQRSMKEEHSCSLSDSAFNHQLQKRAIRQSRRDYKQTVGQVRRSASGQVLLPHDNQGGNAIDGSQQLLKSLTRREEGDSFQAVITWYTGSDLSDPACLPDGGWNPTDESMIAAVTLNWEDKPACGSFLELRRKKHKRDKDREHARSIIVRVMDACAGCKAGEPHVDLTKGAFRQLYELNVGLVGDVEVQILSDAPFDDWGVEETLLYGPKALGKHGNIAEHTSKAESQHHRLHTWSGVDN